MLSPAGEQVGPPPRNAADFSQDDAYVPAIAAVSLVPGPNFGKNTDLTDTPYSWNERAIYSPRQEDRLDLLAVSGLWREFDPAHEVRRP